MKDKKHKKDIEEADNLMVEEVVETMTFDVYFQILLKEQKVLAHHKPPMRQYAQQSNMLIESKDKFDKLFKSY
jgi:hypothetical protein